MSVAEQIRSRLDALQPESLELLDESEQHRGHAGGDVDVPQLERREKQDHREQVEQELHGRAAILPQCAGDYFQPPSAFFAASFSGRSSSPVVDTLTEYWAPSAIGA